jgi:hypothetical protein
MFTEAEQHHIYTCKNKIVRHFEDMIIQPWFNSNIAIDWKKFYLTGGAIASLLQGSEPKDWDIYCSSVIEMESVMKMLLASKEHIADVAQNYIEAYGTDGKMITNNAITMKDGSSFIILLTKPASDLKQTFDYLHCTPHYDIVDRKLYISRAQYDAIVNKKLVVNNDSMVKEWRTQKFLKRGYVKAKNV